MMRLGEAFKIALLENKKLLSTRGRILIENAAFLFDKVKIDIKNEFLLWVVWFQLALSIFNVLVA